MFKSDKKYLGSGNIIISNSINKNVSFKKCLFIRIEVFETTYYAPYFSFRKKIYTKLKSVN